MTPSRATPRRAKSAPPPLPPEWLEAVRAALLDHYDEHSRVLPWRGETDPYRILVSEIMLQQTRVETVETYYGAWLERFPTLRALADADEDVVLKAWEGLGYYRRARNLHRAAQVVRERPGGQLPSSYADLCKLPGVGEYTAGAVASIAFGERVPAPDGNVRRVLARVFDVLDPSPKWLRGVAERLVDPERPGDWNQALMDLGATVCTPRVPRCDACPLRAWCRAAAAAVQEDRPGVRERRPVVRRTFALAVLEQDGRVLLERRARGGLLGGLWAFPEAEVSSAADAPDAARGIAEARGARVLGTPTLLESIAHRFTHFQATYVPCRIPVDGVGGRGAGTAWVAPGAPTDVALPVAQRKVLDALMANVSAAGAASAATT